MKTMYALRIVGADGKSHVVRYFKEEEARDHVKKCIERGGKAKYIGKVKVKSGSGKTNSDPKKR